LSLIESILYGITQGITEFLPISSSAHLALLPKFLHFQDPGAFFDLSLHLGTALAIMLYFRLEVKAVCVDALKMVISRRVSSASEAFSLNLLIATITTVILAFALKGPALEYGRSVVFIGANFIIFGIFMVLADILGPSLPVGLMQTIQKRRSFFIGLAQALALFPGVSRSGATLTMGRVMGLSRIEATRFSFLLSLPLIIGGIILEHRRFLSDEAPFELSSLLIGCIVSFLVGLTVIHYFLKWIPKMGLWPFAVYRICFGIWLLSFY
jgi:undecaprenyl-diphosphatase